MSLDGYIAGPKGESDWTRMDPDSDFSAMSPALRRLRLQAFHTPDISRNHADYHCDAPAVGRRNGIAGVIEQRRHPTSPIHMHETCPDASSDYYEPAGSIGGPVQPAKVGKSRNG